MPKCSFICLLRRDTLEKVFLHFEQSCDFGLISFLGTSDLNVAISYKMVLILMWNADIFIRSYIWLIVGAVVLLIFLLVVLLLLLNLQILGG